MEKKYIKQWFDVPKIKTNAWLDLQVFKWLNEIIEWNSEITADKILDASLKVNNAPNWDFKTELDVEIQKLIWEKKVTVSDIIFFVTKIKYLTDYEMCKNIIEDIKENTERNKKKLDYIKDEKELNNRREQISRNINRLLEYINDFIENQKEFTLILDWEEYNFKKNLNYREIHSLIWDMVSNFDEYYDFREFRIAGEKYYKIIIKTYKKL